MRQLVPTSNEVPALLEQVSTAARRVDLDINTVTPEPVLQGEQFDTYRYKLTVIGGYHELAEFLTNVGSLTRIVAPVNIELAPLVRQRAGDGPAKAGQAMLTSKFEIQTYVAKPSAGQDNDTRTLACSSRGRDMIANSRSMLVLRALVAVAAAALIAPASAGARVA